LTTQAPHAIRTSSPVVAGTPAFGKKIPRRLSRSGRGFGGKVPVYPGYVIATAASW